MINVIRKENSIDIPQAFLVDMYLVTGHEATDEEIENAVEKSVHRGAKEVYFVHKKYAGKTHSNLIYIPSD